MALARTEVEQWYRTHGSMVLRRAKAILGNDALAEEALQEVFITVARMQDTFRGQASPVTWLYRITTNHCIDALRRQRTQRTWLRDAKPLHAHRHTDGVADSDALILLRQVLARADAREASAAIYVFVDQMTYEEVAAVLNVSTSTVKNLVERFCAKARQEITQQLPQTRAKNTEVQP